MDNSEGTLRNELNFETTYRDEMNVVLDYIYDSFITNYRFATINEQDPFPQSNFSPTLNLAPIH